MKPNCIRTLFAVAIACATAAVAQHANDTLLFTINLSDDTSGFFGCRPNQPVHNSLSGPVVMRDHTLLFYSRDGYVLYNQRGRLIDSHSLLRKNRRLARKGKPVLRLAYPVDKSTLVYYTEAGEQSGIGEILLHKGLFSRRLKKVNGTGQESYESIGKSHLLNLYNNSITDEMAAKINLAPHLVGYTSLAGGKRWWSIDKFYSFTSPIILEEDGKYLSFFPGYRGNPGDGVKKTLIEPLGVFWMNGQWYYYGVYSPGGTSREKYLQKLYLCDGAGNLLYTNTILKMTVVDDVLGENEEEKMIYTVKRTGRHAFLPAVDENGDIYYGIVDYTKHRIEVIKRLFYKFVAVPTGPALEDALYREQGYLYEISTAQCGEDERGKPFMPSVRYLDSAGTTTELTSAELTWNGYLAKLMRRKDDELAKTVSRIHQSLPARVRSIQDSLSRLSTAWCPYSLVLTHKKKGELCRFNYGLGDVVICARVLCVTSTFEVIVRVDLVDWAEILVFSTDGKFMNRFRFNNEHHEVRNDVVAVSPDGVMFEKDYEIGEGAYRYYKWMLTTLPPRVLTSRQ